MWGMVGVPPVHTDNYAFTCFNHGRGHLDAFLALFQDVTQRVDWWVTQHMPVILAACLSALTVFSMSWFTRP
jgi:hypothetical protein